MQERRDYSWSGMPLRRSAALWKIFSFFPQELVELVLDAFGILFVQHVANDIRISSDAALPRLRVVHVQVKEEEWAVRTWEYLCGGTVRQRCQRRQEVDPPR